jgi:hypothetical protein
MNQVTKGIPRSVVARLRAKGVKLGEALVCIRVVEACCDGLAVLYTCDNIYDVPLQAGDCVGVDDFLGYMNIAKDDWNYDETIIGKRCITQTYEQMSSWTWWRGAPDRDVFPTKAGDKLQKVNLWFCDVWKDAVLNMPDVCGVLGTRKELLCGCTNVEATAWLLWCCIGYETLGTRVFDVMGACVRERDRSKELNLKCKGFGLQRHKWGSLLCELDVMPGRSTEPLVASDDIKGRIDRGVFMSEKAAVFDKGRLRNAIKKIVSEEMLVTPKWGKVEDYWTRRWEFTKAGAHSVYVHKHLGDEIEQLPPQPTRREFAEACKINVVAHGEPRVDAGFSEKMETGKRRALYSCDTRSYYTFDYLLKPIEAVWRNKKVLLDPGRVGLEERFANLCEPGKVKCMLDFDDFNSQHTLEAMKMVCEVLFENAPAHVRDWAIRSWDNMYVHWLDGARVMESKIVGTLFSGHRATTFINTILNAAYIRATVLRDYEQIEALHAGDDVYLEGPAFVMDSVMRKIRASPCRMNPSKQVVGVHMGEFLRHAFTRKCARAYVARSISSFVNGNWVTENRLSKRSYVETFLRGVWTLNCRGGTNKAGRLVRSSFCRWVPEMAHIACSLLDHKISFDGTPIRDKDMMVTCAVLRVSGGLVKTYQSVLNASVATDEYIHRHVDHKVLKEAGVTVEQLRRAMLKASTKPRGAGHYSKITFETQTTGSKAVVGYEELVRHYRKRRDGTHAAQLAMYHLFPKIDWKRIASIVRGVAADMASLNGMCEWPLGCGYTMPFSSLMAARRITTRSTVVIPRYQVFS